MDDLAKHKLDIDKLSDEQRTIAEKIIDEAIRQKVDPNYALSVAWTENRFGRATSPAGAIGIMQLMPDTAKYKKVNPYDDDENIRGGISFLKDNLDKFEGNKTKAAIAYNAGPNAQYLKTLDLNHLPKETEDYIARINVNHSLVNQPQEMPKSQNVEQGNTSPTEVVENIAPSGVVPDTRPSDMPGVAKAEKKGLGALGAAAGATTAGAVEKGKILLPLLPNAYRAIMQQPLNDNAPTTRSNLQTGMQRYLESQHHQKVHLDDLEKAYNDFLKSKDPTAATKKLRTMSEVQEALKAVKPTEAERTKVGSGPRGSIYRTTAGSSGIDLSKYAANPNTPVTNAVKSGLRTAGNVGRAVLPVAARVATGALGGFNALTEGYDTAESFKKHGAGDRRTIGKGMKTIGGGLMMIPGLQAPGAALTALGMIPDEGVDYYNELKKRQSEATPESMKQAFESYPMGN